MHKEELDVTDVADEESLVAGGHHVLGLLVGTEADLYVAKEQPLVSCSYHSTHCRLKSSSTNLVSSLRLSA